VAQADAVVLGREMAANLAKNVEFAAIPWRES